MAVIGVTGVGKRFGEFVAVSDFNLETRDGEFVVLVGPSGCGKTTTMRILAGLEDATEGAITIDGQDVTDLEPRERDVAMVFQNYALYPHLSVYENMAFCLKVKGMKKAAIEETVRRTAGALGLTPLLERLPGELSGGQRQRVALGRAIVRAPRIFLMDEPLSNLDAKLRIEMRAEITKLCRRLKITTFYVTHDQLEAMTMGERIVVMHGGRVQQIAPPQIIYDRPVNRFVAGFIGSPPMNFLDGLSQTDGSVVEGASFRLRTGNEVGKALAGRSGGKVVVGVRPEHLAPVAGGHAEGIRGTVELIEPLGSQVMIQLRVGDDLIIAQFEQDPTLRVGQDLVLSHRPQSLHAFDPTSERSVLAA
ncbi:MULTISPECIES: ABC transporter ATP-binding protein [unclassified Aureimonas]|uniref:ABC transporter ATP-binding protein n=1 Tax=unclassified Aureimonas TaxID=2615206 RepID=UPI0006FBA652|nr:MULTISPECIES: ABC transporter ATP-binding protein [unclassified Aureimonas]KQT63307.1 glycerol-3-phosphate ABC transporter ATP-binding protein [Aureimonas sp. Leaf427]KQT80113.1 glycerol-3-phosphate ABC transporter ATP-binding protein [Aureimonas sp. Leaf460]